ncbi:angiopoietin-related protein 1-like [Anoplophora glabripennis]|uniref:angiopoietin-related protein 1-like n=1 Tax=Anoplophora glabripennis TaxID=217634 RepID=UPI000873B991|nr:angiopoietin-related protein 1-like [Anoplophora glabripennis]
MDTIRLTNIVILIGVFLTRHIKASNATFSAPKSLLPKVKSNQENSCDVNSNGFDIHLTVESSKISSNFRDEIIAVLKDFNKGTNCVTEEKSEEESPILSRSIELGNLEAKLDYISTKFQTIEKALEDIQTDYKKLSLSIEEKTTDLGKVTSVGVRCSSCNKAPKNRTSYPKSCKEIQRNGNNVTGIYEIQPRHSKKPFPVLCDMNIRDGGWTHIQKRFDGSQDFNLEWRDYKFGFGNLEGEFWLGLEKIYSLTGFEPAELLVEVVDRGGVSAYAHYNSFGIGPETGAYKLERLSGFSGDAGDSLTHHFGEKFSTKDIDFTKRRCATLHLGGWWFRNCLWSNLNGKCLNIDLPLTTFYYVGSYWYTYKDENCLSASRMLVRPVN